jgi:hypothetical protein
LDKEINKIVASTITGISTAYIKNRIMFRRQSFVAFVVAPSHERTHIWAKRNMDALDVCCYFISHGLFLFCSLQANRACPEQNSQIGLISHGAASLLRYEERNPRLNPHPRIPALPFVTACYM